MPSSGDNVQAERGPAARGPDLAVLLALLAVQLTFSGLHIFGKVVLEAVHPLALASLRVLFATPVLMLLAWRHDRVLPSRRMLPSLALLGLLGVFFNQLLFITGLELTTATNAAILMPSIPVFAIAVAALFRIERIGVRRVVGIALTVAGALVLLEPGRLSAGGREALGNLLVLANCLSYAAFLVVQRPVLVRLPWRTVVAWAFLFGGLGVLAVGGDELAATEMMRLEPRVLWGIAYILIFPTVIGYTLNTWAVRRSSPSLVAAFTTLQPLLTATFALLLLGEPAGWREAAGFLLIAAGLWRVSRRR
jgi:drug/metabolite transporter (DMT)-like permease